MARPQAGRGAATRQRWGSSAPSPGAARRLPRPPRLRIAAFRRNAMTRLLAALAVTLLPVFASAQTPSPPFADNVTLLHLTEQAQRLVTRDRLRLVLRVEAV